MSTRKIDGRKAEIINTGDEYTTYTSFAAKYGYPEAAAKDDEADMRKPLKDGDVVTLIVSGNHHSLSYPDPIWIVEAANGERHLIGEAGLRILDEDHALNDEITVLPDESLGGVLREYREVKRQARVGERVKVVAVTFAGSPPAYKIGDVLMVTHFDDDEYPVVDRKFSDGSEVFLDAEEYVVLESTDIVYVDNKRFRMVDREAAVGERVIIVNVEEDVSEEFGYKNGQVYEVKELFDGYPFIWTGSTAGSEVYLEREEFRVLEPVSSSDPTPAPLSTQPATDQIAENIANLTAKVTELETRLNALYDWHKRAAVDIRVAREDIVLVEEGVADAIKSLESRVSALENVKVASGPVDTTPPDFIKTPQQIRDEIVERAKADVKALLNTPEYGIEALDGAYISYIPHIHRVKFVINRDKRTIVALVQDRRTDKLRLRGIAKCAPSDVFNAHIGRAIALRRALGLEIPAEYLNAPNPTEIRVGDVVDYGCRIATVALDGRSIDTRTHTFISTAVGCGATIIDDSRESEKGAAA